MKHTAASRKALSIAMKKSHAAKKAALLAAGTEPHLPIAKSNGKSNGKRTNAPKPASQFPNHVGVKNPELALELARLFNRVLG